MKTVPPSPARLDHLDAVRAFALLLGIVFHACLSFLSSWVGWAVMDVSTSRVVDAFATVSHSFRMGLFFLIAGFFSHLTFHRKGLRSFLQTRFLRVAVPFLVGWWLLRPLVVSGWIIGGASMRGEADFFGGLREAFLTLRAQPEAIYTGTHLWFLYYLMLATVLVLALRMALKTSAPLVRVADALTRWIATHPLGIALLALPTGWVVWTIGQWSVATPDQSLAPYWKVLGVYGGCFGLGWMLRRNDLLAEFSRLTPTRIIIGVMSVGATLWLARYQADPGHPHFHRAQLTAGFAYGFMAWSLIMLTLGGFARLIQGSSTVVRYVADSSYWMYLIHLPIVLWLQIAVAELPWHWSLKLTAISAATIAFSLLTYDLFVRSTFIGRLLNGQRRQRVIFAWRWSGRPAEETVITVSRRASPFRARN